MALCWRRRGRHVGSRVGASGGIANDLAGPLSAEERASKTKQVVPASLPPTDGQRASTEPITAATALDFAKIAMVDIVVFFGVLLVGFAYLWKRGDIDWVRTVAAEIAAEPPPPAPVLPKPSAARTFAGAAHSN